MREIKYTNRFKRDYKREKAGQHGRKLDAVLMEAVKMLAADAQLPRRYFVYENRIRRLSAISPQRGLPKPINPVVRTLSVH